VPLLQTRANAYPEPKFGLVADPAGAAVCDALGPFRAMVWNESAVPLYYLRLHVTYHGTIPNRKPSELISNDTTPIDRAPRAA
jgi:hypothetical protein